MTGSLHLAQVAVLTAGAGVLMLRMGIGKRLLRARHESRRCASCGRRIETRVCPRCEGS